MAAGYGPTREQIVGEAEEADGGCLIEFPHGNCLTTRNQFFNNVGAAAAAGTVAGIVGTLVSLSIVIPLTPILSQMGIAAGAANVSVG